MDKTTGFFKNLLLFLVIFMAVNYLMQGCQNKEEDLLVSSGNLLFTTTDNEYSKSQKVTVKIENNTKNVIVIPDECPNEPFSVFRKENNEWVPRESAPEIDCSASQEIELLPGQNHTIPYNNWNYSLFSDMGIFKIDFTTEVEGEEQTFSTNEFIVTEDGLFKQVSMGFFYKPIYNGLIFLVSALPGHGLGWAIILLTLIIRTILLIPSQNAMKSQKRLQEIQPRLEKIKKKYEGDQQKIAMETMAIWKEAKVNPFGSCLPLLLQFPFLIALFYVVQGGINPDNAYLFYSDYGNFNLQDIDVMFLGILDLTKANIYVLPFVIGGLQFFQMKLTMGRKAKKTAKQSNEMAMASSMMTYVMPVMIAVFTATLPAGVGIYWGTSTSYGIVQQLFVNKGGSTSKNEPTVKVIDSK
jgi:YidC/Oxa1 family membrane protein insertase